MLIYKSKWFSKWASKQGLSDESLRSAITELKKGLVDAHLGSNVFKKRVAIQGQGKRSSLRTLVAAELEGKAFFIYGFSKSSRANITDKELHAFRRLSTELLSYNCNELELAVQAGSLIEVKQNER